MIRITRLEVSAHALAAIASDGILKRDISTKPLQKTHQTGEKLAISWSRLFGVVLRVNFPAAVR